MRMGSFPANPGRGVGQVKRVSFTIMAVVLIEELTRWPPSRYGSGEKVHLSMFRTSTSFASSSDANPAPLTARWLEQLMAVARGSTESKRATAARTFGKAVNADHGRAEPNLNW